MNGAVISFAVSCHGLKRKVSSILSMNIGAGAEPGISTVRCTDDLSHKPGSRMPLLAARPIVTVPAAEHYHYLAGVKLYCST